MGALCTLEGVTAAVRVLGWTGALMIMFCMTYPDLGGVGPAATFYWHPTLMAFPSEVIYHGQLCSGVSAADRPPVGGFEWPRDDVPLAFVEVEARESVEQDSKLNRAEAERHVRTHTGDSPPLFGPSPCSEGPAALTRTRER